MQALIPPYSLGNHRPPSPALPLDCCAPHHRKEPLKTKQKHIYWMVLKSLPGEQVSRRLPPSLLEAEPGPGPVHSEGGTSSYSREQQLCPFPRGRPQPPRCRRAGVQAPTKCKELPRAPAPARVSGACQHPPASSPLGRNRATVVGLGPLALPPPAGRDVSAAPRPQMARSGSRTQGGSSQLRPVPCGR